MNTSQEKTTRRRMVLVLGGSLLLFGVLCLARVVFDAQLGFTGAITDGVVTKIEMRSSSSGVTSRRSGETWSEYERRRDRQRGSVSYDCSVRFTPAAGEPRDFKTVSTFGHDRKVGDAVKVIYLASNPGRAEIYSAKQVWLPLCVGGIVTIASLTGAWFFFRLARRWKA